jgi:uncharacterized protein (TIGR03118 family)
MQAPFVFPRRTNCLSDATRTTNRPKHRMVVRTAFLAASSVMLSMAAMAQSSTPSTYTQTNIISNIAGKAATTDPLLINPWGVSVGPLIWIDATGSGVVEADTAAGAIDLSVTIPAAGAGGVAPTPPPPGGGYASSTATHGTPTGTVFNSAATGFNLTGGAGSALFLFSTLDGTIAGWSASSGTQAVTMVTNSGAAYTGLALDTTATGGPVLLAANFGQSRVDAINSSFAAATLAGNFTDPNLPTGYAPFGIHVIGGNVYVTYAQVSATTGFGVGATLGYVDKFDANGNFMARFVSQGALNAPWGMALAPAGFGSYGGDILIGNFGDGVINAYDTTGNFVGSLQSAPGTSIANPGLWEIFFGGGGTVGDANTLYFAAGVDNEADGLFGSIAVVAPITPGAPGISFGTTPPSTLSVTNGMTGTLSLSLAGTNGFSGPVTLSCTGQPTGDSCAFSTNPVTLSATGSTAVMLTFSAAANVAPTPSPSPYAGGHLAMLGSHGGLTLAFIAPLGLFAFAGVRRRRAAIRGVLFLLVLGAISLTATGCSSAAPNMGGTTPAAPTTFTMMVTGTAASGVSASIPVSITVN